jgi:hypothetical protein
MDSPTCAAADVAIELLYKHQHKHPKLSHVLVVPHLMTGRFCQHALKQADVYFLPVPLEFVLWSQEWHEPLLIFIFLPIFLYSKPWCLKGDTLVTEFTDNMLQMHVGSFSWEVRVSLGGTSHIHKEDGPRGELPGVPHVSLQSMAG